MKKNLLLRLCLILMVAFTAYSCRTDQFPENETFNDSSKFQLTSKRISLDESKHKSKIIPLLEKTTSDLQKIKTSSAFGRTISYGDSISIDTDDVVLMENGPNYYTYTFNISRKNASSNAPVENLVLSPMSDGTYREILVTYNLTEQEKEIIRSGKTLDLKHKTEFRELASGTFSSGMAERTTCYDYLDFAYTTCNGNDHHSNGEAPYPEGPCRGTVTSQLVVVIRTKCEYYQDVTDGSGWMFGGGGNPSTGGGSEGNNNNPPIECETPVLQNPQNSDLNSAENPCGTGVPTQPNLPLPDRTTPCEKTKKILENLEVEEKNNELKEKSKIGGEKGFNIKADGTTSAMIDGGEHEVDMGSEVGWQGGYHNHTPTGVKIFSPPDILKLLNYAISQPNGTYSNAFFGVLGSESCTTCTGGYEYRNYIIQFNGTGQDLDKYLYQTIWDKIALVRTYRKTAFELLKNPDNVKSEDKLNSNGLEKLFFETLKNMGMEGKVNLQRIENQDNGTTTIQNITQDNNGNPTATPCP
ncbi:hypothetical protein [Chryseobacterium sp. 2R14A]|uniref:hypothetical protein n=1 Tax=Chryseobacterium sp. 2R14A TaxID=3380353 RepID=UPI003CEFE80A